MYEAATIETALEVPSKLLTEPDDDSGSPPSTGLAEKEEVGGSGLSGPDDPLPVKVPLPVDDTALPVDDTGALDDAAVDDATVDDETVEAVDEDFTEPVDDDDDDRTIVDEDDDDDGAFDDPVDDDDDRTVVPVDDDDCDTDPVDDE